MPSCLHGRFTMSTRLETAARRAFEHLRPGGVLVVEDFDREAMDRDTARWLYSLSEILWLAGIAEQSEFPSLGKREPLEHWVDEHSHEPPIHSRHQMATAVERGRVKAIGFRLVAAR